MSASFYLSENIIETYNLTDRKFELHVYCNYLFNCHVYCNYFFNCHVGWIQYVDKYRHYCMTSAVTNYAAELIASLYLSAYK
jgi:hypothetical protein